MKFTHNPLSLSRSKGKCPDSIAMKERDEFHTHSRVDNRSSSERHMSSQTSEEDKKRSRAITLLQQMPAKKGFPPSKRRGLTFEERRQAVSDSEQESV